MDLCLQSSELLQQHIAIVIKSIHFSFSPISGRHGKGRTGSWCNQELAPVCVALVMCFNVVWARLPVRQAFSRAAHLP
jgi:hypothetical protein